MTNETTVESNENAEILQQIGVLEERTDGLDEVCDETDVNPEEVGKWITVIGRALLAIFKPT